MISLWRSGLFGRAGARFMAIPSTHPRHQTTGADLRAEWPSIGGYFSGYAARPPTVNPLRLSVSNMWGASPGTRYRSSQALKEPF